MASTTIRNIATGKPARVNVNPRLDRTQSRKAVLQTGVDSPKQMSNLVKNRNDASPESLGRGAVQVTKSGGNVNMFG